MKIRILSLLLAASALLTGCDSELDKRTTLSFIGDSIIARWDLQDSFSSLITYNLGQSGAGISYIESYAGRLGGRNIVVMTGTNDNTLMAAPDSRRAYAERYIAALEATGAAHIYLYEVLPRGFHNDRPGTNDDIRAFNAEVRRLIDGRSDIDYIDVYSLFLGDDAKIYSEYYNDGLHLSPQGYEVLTSRLFRFL